MTGLALRLITDSIIIKGTRIFRENLIILILFSFSLFAKEQTDTSMTIEGILNSPEEEIDIGLADLVLARDFYPELKIESFLFSFDYLADRFKHYFGDITDPDQRVRALNTFLYRKGSWNDKITFGYDENDLNVKMLSNKFINGYLSTRKGSCITMPMMYLILAERLGFPLYASRLPYHFFIRYIPEEPITNFQENIEATNGGSFVPDSEYQRNFLVPDKAIANGVYLRTLSKKEYIATLLLVNSDEWITRKNFNKAKHYLELAMKYDSTFSSAYMNYAMIHLREALSLEKKMHDEEQSEITIYNASRNRGTDPVSPKGQRRADFSKSDVSPILIPLEVDITKTAQRFESPKSQGGLFRSQMQSDPNLNMVFSQVEQQYEPDIKEEIAAYQKYKGIADNLGIVRGYPLLFFQNQSNELKEFQEKGAK